MTGPWTTGLPEHLDLPVGQAATVELPAAHGGYDWSVTSSAPDVVAAAVQLGEAPGQGATPTSGSAPQRLVIEPRARGSAELELRLARPWQPQEPLAVHRLQVQAI